MAAYGEKSHGRRQGDAYKRDWASFDPIPVPLSVLARGYLFERHGAALLDLSGRSIHELAIRVTPYQFVPITCVLLHARPVSAVTYGAEASMSRVFDTKAKSGGLSTDRLAGRNVYPLFVPL